MSSRILHRQIGAHYCEAVSGAGIFLKDANGKTYLDGSGGAAVSCLGHGHPKVVAAIKKQVETIAFAHSAYFTTRPAEQLAARLIARAPEGFGRVGFFSGGSEAIEAAIKLARQYHVERGEPDRRHFIARKQSYHGASLGALGAGSFPTRREAFLPLIENMPFSHIDPCYAYREQAEGESEEDYALRAAQLLAQEIESVGPENVAAFIAETVVGATLGAVPAAAGYFTEIRRICDKYGILLILDEVMCGSGRTGRFFACKGEGVTPDIITIAKGLGAGYQPIGAIVITDKIVECLEQGSGAFHHGHTYMGHATACAAALAVQDVIDEEKLLENVRVRAEQLQVLLRASFGQHPHIGDIRGRGLFVGIELVRDRETKAPFSPMRKVAGNIRNKAMEHGLIFYPGSGTLDGVKGDHILLAPPYIISQDELEMLVDRLSAAIDDVL